MLENKFALPTMILGMLLLIPGCLCDVSHLIQYGENLETTPSPPPVPYNFHYKAGRFPGQIDRYQSESGDGAGVVHGTYSFIDPKFKIRTADYTADKNGFHPVLTNYEDVMAQPQDSEAVKLAKEKHFALYSRIASENANPQYSQGLPLESASVVRARNKHFELFQKISAEHQAIGSRREAERLAFEATSVPNDIVQQVVY